MRLAARKRRRRRNYQYYQPAKRIRLHYELGAERMRARCVVVTRQRSTGHVGPYAPRCRGAALARLLPLALLAVWLAGCAAEAVTLRKTPRNVLAERLKLLSRGGPQPTDRTRQLLRRHDLLDDLKGDPHRLLAQMQQAAARHPSADMEYSMAEVAYLAGNRAELTDPQLALDMYGTAVMHAYRYLFDPGLIDDRNPYDPQYRGACDVYNQALENALRLLHRRDLLRPGSTLAIRTAGESVALSVEVVSETWQAEDFDSFEFASDYEINGLTNRYVTHGLGVPLIAVRKKKPHADASTLAPSERGPGSNAAERFYPPDLSFPVTAFLRPLPPRRDGKPGERHAVLELYDPLVSTDLLVADRVVPLESDLSTPLAFFLNNRAFRDTDLATAGLLNPSRGARVQGLYMLEPYQPGKIPVLMVHGLWSSPMTWVEMFNDLRSLPEIRQRYQFWFYLYPTGQPFWYSAAQLRDDLAEVRATFDPAGREPALDEMVLVGHSMGGLVSMLQTLDSEDRFWATVSPHPPDRLTADDELRASLASAVFFESNRSVRRVVTIGTPHRGSNFANTPTRWLARHLIRLPDMLLGGQRIRRDNPGLLADPSLVDITTSIDSLAQDSPFFPAMLEAPRPPDVRFHNVVGVIERRSWLGRIAGAGDGVVPLDSARREDADSEIMVPADHVSIHSHPRSVLEVWRILQEHLDEIDGRHQRHAQREAIRPDRLDRLDRFDRSEARHPAVGPRDRAPDRQRSRRRWEAPTYDLSP